MDNKPENPISDRLFDAIFKKYGTKSCHKILDIASLKSSTKLPDLRTLERWQAKESAPSMDLLEALCDALDVSFSDITAGTITYYGSDERIALGTKVLKAALDHVTDESNWDFDHAEAVEALIKATGMDHVISGDPTTYSEPVPLVVRSLLPKNVASRTGFCQYELTFDGDAVTLSVFKQKVKKALPTCHDYFNDEVDLNDFKTDTTT